MSRKKQRVMAATICVPTAVLLLASIAVLIGDYVVALRRAPADKERIAALEKAARSDVVQVPVLAAELDRQTQLSLRRVGRQNTATGVLIVSSLLFLASAKWLVSLRGAKAPALDRIAATRMIEPSRARKPRRGKARKDGRARREAARADAVRAAMEVDLTFVDTVIAREGRGREAAITILQAIQSHYGYLPDQALRRVCELTEIKPAQIAGVSTFYAQFRRTPAGRHIVKVCHGTACHVSGARQITEEIRRHLAIAPESDTDPQRMFTVDKVACLGCCSLAPVIMIDDKTVGRLTPTQACEAIEKFREKEPGT